MTTAVINGIVHDVVEKRTERERKKKPKKATKKKKKKKKSSSRVNVGTRERKTSSSTTTEEEEEIEDLSLEIEEGGKEEEEGEGGVQLIFITQEDDDIKFMAKVVNNTPREIIAKNKKRFPTLRNQTTTFSQNTYLTFNSKIDSNSNNSLCLDHILLNLSSRSSDVHSLPQQKGELLTVADDVGSVTWTDALVTTHLDITKKEGVEKIIWEGTTYYKVELYYYQESVVEAESWEDLYFSETGKCKQFNKGGDGEIISVNDVEWGRFYKSNTRRVKRKGREEEGWVASPCLNEWRKNEKVMMEVVS